MHIIIMMHIIILVTNPTRTNERVWIHPRQRVRQHLGIIAYPRRMSIPFHVESYRASLNEVIDCMTKTPSSDENLFFTL